MRSLLLALAFAGCASPRPPPAVTTPVAASAAPAPTPSASAVAIAAPTIEPPSAAPIPPQSGEPTPPGTEPAPAAEKPESVIAKLRPKFRACFAKGLADDPSTQGNAKFTLTIDGTGKVTAAKQICSTLPKPVTECLRKVYLGVDFASGPATTTVGGPC